jgi:hypothetical protein
MGVNKKGGTNGEVGMKTIVLGSCAALFVFVPTSAFGREWRNAKGTATCEADFLAYRDGWIWLTMPDGAPAAARWERYSAADQAYVRDLLMAKSIRLTTPAILAVRAANFQTGNAPPNYPAQVVPFDAPASNAGSQASNTSALGGKPTSDDAEIQMLGSENAQPTDMKIVYFADCGTFQIIDNGQAMSSIVGTAHYSALHYSPPYGCDCSCSPCYGPWYLSLLTIIKRNYPWTPPNAKSSVWLEARETSASKVKYWRFNTYSNYTKGLSIWYSTTGNNDADFKYYLRADRVRPN